MNRAIAITLTVVAAPAAVFLAVGGGDAPDGDGSSAHLVIPNLSSRAHTGREHFAAACGSCHGAYGEGSDVGPVLIHALYGEEVFRDAQIMNAVRHGASARNWPFGDMPAMKNVSDDQLALMIGFLREVQTANGVE
ncbi:MAG: cytochrome c [Paracoccaceae bacterium]